jgi:excisionase family DNA binding protein
MNSDVELLTLEEARQLLRFSKSKLYAERRSGRLRSRYFGRRAVRIHRQDLDQYIQAASTSEAARC